ncbi:MAG TPA: DUF4476 domain-containing protein [Flavitalea sp.]|nr:DUF4476 domain-containing protein [Flavitalea sp.]
MKTTFTLLTGLFLSFIAMAAPNDSRLSITVAGNGGFEVMVDNQRYQERDNSVLITNLNPGYHTIKVYKVRSQSSGRNIWGKNNRNNDLLYSTSVNIRSRQFVDIVINRFGRALVDERTMNGNDDWMDDNDPYTNEPYNSGNYGNDNYGRNDEYRSPLSEMEFARLREQVRRENFENARLTLARQITERNFLSSQQVKQLLQFFSFENNKLELAKVAYRNTTDKRNYYMIYDVFSFSRSREELTQYIERYR